MKKTQAEIILEILKKAGALEEDKSLNLTKLKERVSFPLSSVARCVDALEKEGEIKTKMKRTGHGERLVWLQKGVPASSTEQLSEKEKMDLLIERVKARDL